MAGVILAPARGGKGKFIGGDITHRPIMTRPPPRVHEPVARCAARG